MQVSTIVGEWVRNNSAWVIPSRWEVARFSLRTRTIVLPMTAFLVYRGYWTGNFGPADVGYRGAKYGPLYGKLGLRARPSRRLSLAQLASATWRQRQLRLLATRLGLGAGG